MIFRSTIISFYIKIRNIECKWNKDKDLSVILFIFYYLFI